MGNYSYYEDKEGFIYVKLQEAIHKESLEHYVIFRKVNSNQLLLLPLKDFEKNYISYDSDAETCECGNGCECC